MIVTQKGNLLEANAEALVNTVNCKGVMGKGVALQFRQAFDDNFKQYQRACRAGQVVPGRMFIVENQGLIGPRYIINFPTKRHWKDKSRIEDIEAGLQALVEDVKRLGIRSIALPPLGCGNGGLEWSEVGPRIRSAFAAVPEVRVLLYEPQDAPAANAMLVATKKPRMTRARALFIRLLDLYHRYAEDTLTKLEAQKLAYLVQEAGEPLKLDFVKHRLGPYADKVNHALQSMEGHYIRGFGDRIQRSEITVLPGARETADRFLADMPEAVERLERVRRLIEGFETPYGMELLATVHWVATRECLLASTDVEQAIASVHSWSKRKREYFRREHIVIAWQRLRDQGWLDAETPSLPSAKLAA